MVHVLGHFRQLTRTAHGIRIDHKRRQQFRVAVLLRMHVEHVLDQRTLQTGTRAQQQRKPGAAHARSAWQIENAQFFRNRNMILRLEGECTQRTFQSRHAVGRSVGPGWNGRTRHIGNAQHSGLKFGLDHANLLIQRRNLIAQRTHFRLHRCRIFTAFAGRADLFGSGITPVFHLFRRPQQGAPFAVELQHAIQQGRISATAIEPCAYFVCLFADTFDVEHDKVRGSRVQGSGFRGAC